MTKNFIPKTSNQRKIFILLLLAGLLIGSILLTFAVISRNRTTEITNGNQAEYNKSKKEATIDNGGVPVESSADAKNPSNGTYTAPNNSEGIDILPSRSGGQVTISTRLNGYSDGECNIAIANGARNYRNQAKIIYAPSFSTCAGFSVPVDSLGSGTWEITLEVVSGGITTTGSKTYVVE